MTADDILRQTAVAFGLEVADLIGPSRARRLIPARQAAAWALRHGLRPQLTLLEIAALLGRADHSTISHALAGAEARRRRDRAYAATLRQILGQPPRPACRDRGPVLQLDWQFIAPPPRSRWPTAGTIELCAGLRLAEAA